MFAPTELNQKNEKVQKWIGRLMGAMTIVLIIPVILVLSMLIIRGAPAISWAFLVPDHDHLPIA